MKITTTLLLVFILAGCSTPGMQVSIPTWQKNVESYVRDVGHGDPVVLRDVEYLDRPGFAQLGYAVPAEGTDAIGLLVGHRVLNGRPSFIYLLGMVNKEKVEDIRVVVLQPIPSSGAIQFKWMIGQSDAKALSTYLNQRHQEFAARFPGRKDIPPAYTSFPAQEDSFDLGADPGQVTVVHRNSGAVWKVGLRS